MLGFPCAALAVLLAGVSALPFCASTELDPGWTLLIYYSVDYVDSGIGDRDQDRDRTQDGEQDPDRVRDGDGNYRDETPGVQQQPQDRVGDELSGHPSSTPEATMEVELAALIEATRPASGAVRALVLVDRLTEDGLSLFEIADGAVVPLSTWEEQNTAEPAVLEAFVTLGATRYPDSTTALFVTGEGHGWRGICRDREAGDPEAAEDLMSVHEIAGALDNAAAAGALVDLLVFNGANMASIEVAYELRDTVPLMVATQSQIQEDGIPYGMFVADLIESPDMSVAEFATCIVEAHVEYYSGGKSGASAKKRTAGSADPGDGELDPDSDSAGQAQSATALAAGDAATADPVDADPNATGDGRERLAYGGGQIAQDFANLCALDLSRIGDVVVAHTEFSTLLAGLMEDLHNVIPAARDASMVGHHNDISDYDYLSDIYTFVSVLGELLDERREETYPELRSAMDAYRSAHEQALVAEAHAEKFHNTNGLSIWYPGSLNSYELRDSGNVELKFGETFFYEDPALGLDFVTDSAWVDYLYAYYTAVGGHGSE
jgi:hypothetical protein